MELLLFERLCFTTTLHTSFISDRLAPTASHCPNRCGSFGMSLRRWKHGPRKRAISTPFITLLLELRSKMAFSHGPEHDLSCEELWGDMCKRISDDSVRTEQNQPGLCRKQHNTRILHYSKCNVTLSFYHCSEPHTHSGY